MDKILNTADAPVEESFDPTKKHPSHETRVSMDASSYDEICEKCGATDIVPGGWGNLAKPCLHPDGPKKY